MKKFVLIVLVLGLTGSCKKKKTQEEETTPVTPPVTVAQNPVTDINVPADADGALWASQIPYEFTNFYVTQLGKSSAFFYSAPGNYSCVDAGVVKCNDSVLVKVSGGSFLFSGKAINGQPYSGINYASGATWTVAGTTSVPAFSVSAPSFPTPPALTSSTLISKAAPYVLTYSGVTNADSVVIILNGDSTFRQKKTVVSSAGSFTFTAAEIGKIKKIGSGLFPYLTMISYNMQSTAVSAKKYYFINSNTSTYRINTY